MLLLRISPCPTRTTKLIFKTGVPFRSPNQRQKNRLIHRQLVGHNLWSQNSEHCFRLQDPVLLLTCSVFSTSYSSERNHLPHRCRSGEPPCHSGNQTDPSYKGGFFQSSVPSPQKGQNLPACNRLQPHEKVCGEHFQVEKISCIKSLFQRDDYMTTLNLKDIYLSVSVHKDSCNFCRETHALSFKASVLA